MALVFEVYWSKKETGTSGIAIFFSVSRNSEILFPAKDEGLFSLKGITSVF